MTTPTTQTTTTYATRRAARIARKRNPSARAIAARKLARECRCASASDKTRAMFAGDVPAGQVAP